MDDRKQQEQLQRIRGSRSTASWLFRGCRSAASRFFIVRGSFSLLQRDEVKKRSHFVGSGADSGDAVGGHRQKLLRRCLWATSRRAADRNVCVEVHLTVVISFRIKSESV